MPVARRIVEPLPNRACILFLLVLVWFVLWAPHVGAQDILAQHFDAAQNALRAGDQDRASIEYKAFLLEALHRVANARAHFGDLHEAAQTFEEALGFSGADSGMRLDYASVQFDRNRTDEARSETEKVVTSEPNNVRAQVLMGRICFEQNDYDGARKHLETVNARVEFREVWRLLAITYLRLQQLDRAQALLRKAKAQLPDTPTNRVAFATAYYYGDYPDLAVEELKKVIAQDNAAPEAHYHLGLAYLGHNEEAGYTQAIPEFQAQLNLNPKDFSSRYMLGHIALEQRNFAKAEIELTRAAALKPDDEGTQLQLGGLYSTTHRIAQAESVLRKLIASRAGAPPDFAIVRAHYILGRLLQQDRKDEGATEIRVSEQLRKQLRMSAAAASENQGHGARVISAQEADERQTRAKVSPEEQQKAQAFVGQLSPLIGEAYHNLGLIAARQKNSASAADYGQRALAWDPSLAQGGKN